MPNVEDADVRSSEQLAPPARATRQERPANDDRLDEYICYGDRVAFLCEGQLLALTRKFNLTYQQMGSWLPPHSPRADSWASPASSWGQGHSQQNTVHRNLQSHHHTSGVAGEPDAPVGGSKAAHGSVAFRLFEFDPKKQQLVFSSVGLPVKFGLLWLWSTRKLDELSDI
ncbi:hypothetical protein GQ600_27474 [Phytophthora cactorum]|nr:hypothetical protein GQ600_27474 [Phytophthora cactorum]